jgi:tetratricopeptide (TPR) repeat protein/transcriptional regulator with XRE-family HTH domain
MIEPGRVSWLGSRGRALGCRGGLGAGCGLVPTVRPGPVQEHRHGGGHDRGAYGDEDDLPAGHAAGDDDLHGGQWCHGPVAAAPGGGTGRANAAGAATAAASRAVASAARMPATRRRGRNGRVRFMVTPCGRCWGWVAGCGRRSLIVGGLDPELGAQPPGLAGGAAQAPFGALGAAGGPRQRVETLGGALRLGVREPLAVVVAGEVGELVHDGHLLPGGDGLVPLLPLSPSAGAVTIRSRAQQRHRIRLGGEAVLASQPGPGSAPDGRRGRGPVVDGPVTGPAGPVFGGLLRQLRDQAGLTQDELAEAAGVSQRAISDLERGINRTARKDTAVLLAGALGLDGPARELFVAAARGRAQADKVLEAAREARAGGSAAASRTLPRDIPAFTGRQAELAQLMARWAEAAADGGVVSIHAIGGMAGIGKTTFAVHAAHRLADRFPDGQFFLPLHAHTPGQRPVGPADALASLLLIAGVSAGQIPPGTDARAARWRHHAAGKKVLLVLDDAAGHEQVRPLLPGTPGSLVLITSRRRLAALEDAAVLSLDTLTPSEAAGLLARLADRADVSVGDAVVGEIVALCGYLPLAIGMIGRQLAYHPAWTPAGLATDLAAAKDRLELMAAENLSVAAAFGLSYQDLTDGQQRLFRRLGLHPGPDIDACAAAALDHTTPPQAHRGLEDLYDQHLITQPAPSRYRFHDLLREHARTLAAEGDPADSAAAAGRLLDYYQQAALAASGHIPARAHGTRPPAPAPPPAGAPPLATPAQATQWLEAERPNLHAAAGYAATHGQHQQAAKIAAAVGGFLYTRGYWDQAIALQHTALAAARRAGDRPGQAAALHQLCILQAVTGDSPAAAASQRRAQALYRDLGDRHGQAQALYGLCLVHGFAHDYLAAIAAGRQALDLYRDLGDPYGQNQALSVLGDLHTVTGDYPAAAASLLQALGLHQDIIDRNDQAVAISRLAEVQRLTGDYPAATAGQRQALAVFRDVGDRIGEVFTLAEIGLIQVLTGDYPVAAASLGQALDLSRELGDRCGQAYALNHLGTLHTAIGDYPAAAASLQQALAMFGDLCIPYEQADALNNLGELLTRSSDSRQARDHHVRALAMARDIGAPLQEARALEGIGQSRILEGNPADGAAPLRQALAIYQRIGTPGALRVQQTLRQHGL